MAFLFSMMLIILAMGIWSNSLRNQNAKLSDNDLKYRYIQMQGSVTTNDFIALDSLFYSNRNSKKIKALCKQVKTFEENVKQRARILEQEEWLKRERMQLDEKLLQQR